MRGRGLTTSQGEGRETAHPPRPKPTSSYAQFKPPPPPVTIPAVADMDRFLLESLALAPSPSVSSEEECEEEEAVEYESSDMSDEADDDDMGTITRLYQPMPDLVTPGGMFMAESSTFRPTAAALATVVVQEAASYASSLTISLPEGPRANSFMGALLKSGTRAGGGGYTPHGGASPKPLTPGHRSLPVTPSKMYPGCTFPNLPSMLTESAGRSPAMSIMTPHSPMVWDPPVTAPASASRPTSKKGSKGAKGGKGGAKANKETRASAPPMGSVQPTFRNRRIMVPTDGNADFLMTHSFLGTAHKHNPLAASISHLRGHSAATSRTATPAGQAVQYLFVETSNTPSGSLPNTPTPRLASDTRPLEMDEQLMYHREIDHARLAGIQRAVASLSPLRRKANRPTSGTAKRGIHSEPSSPGQAFPRYRTNLQSLRGSAGSGDGTSDGGGGWGGASPKVGSSARSAPTRDASSRALSPTRFRLQAGTQAASLAGPSASRAGTTGGADQGQAGLNAEEQYMEQYTGGSTSYSEPSLHMPSTRRCRRSEYVTLSLDLGGLSEHLEAEMVEAEACGVAALDVMDRPGEVYALADLLLELKDVTALLLSKNDLNDESLQSLKDIAALLLSKNDLNDESLQSVLDVLMRPELGHLSQLDLSHNRVTVSSVERLVLLFNQEFFKQVVNGRQVNSTTYTHAVLTDLMLGSNPNVGDSGAELICEALQHETCRLRLLDMSHCQLTERSAAAFSRMLQHTRCMEVLDISWNSFGVRGGKWIAQGLNGCVKLTERSAAAFSRMLQHTRCMEMLDISWNSFGVSRLFMAWTGVGDEGASHIVQQLKTNSSLHLLDLTGNCVSRLFMAWTGVGDEGASHIVQQLKTNSSLHLLDLTGNCVSRLFMAWTGVGDEGASHIVQQLKTNSSLHLLDLTGNCVTPLHGLDRRGGRGSLTHSAAAEDKQLQLALLDLTGNCGGMAYPVSRASSWPGRRGDEGPHTVQQLKTTSSLHLLDLTGNCVRLFMAWAGVGDEGASHMCSS
eukprot:gene28673-31850_t